MFSFIKSGFQKVKQALTKTRLQLSYRIKSLFGQPWEEETFERLEEILYEADLGTACAAYFVGEVRQFLLKNPKASSEQILEVLQKKALELLHTPPQAEAKSPSPGEPLVILIVGVNGSGKTTSLAKLGKRFAEEDKKVLIAAGDTFRAAAIDQLDTWAKRLSLDIVKAKPGSDPSAVAFDALTAAKARGADVVLIDTAGRLQNKTDLMQELEKIKRVCNKVIPHAPHETYLVLDATVGQNAIDQAKTFHQFTPLSGIILTKLDGSAKGGIVLSIYKDLRIPIRWIGVGESADDLMPFDAKNYVEALFSQED